LRRLTHELGLVGRVEFQPALPFGPRLFEELYGAHLSLAAPLIGDTPRSALDALAAGIPLLAFDTEYYASLVHSGAVDIVPWPSVEALAARIAHYAEDKRRLQPLAQAGLEFARNNTQAAWLHARAQWTLALFEPQAEQTVAAGASGT